MKTSNLYTMPRVSRLTLPLLMAGMLCLSAEGETVLIMDGMDSPNYSSFSFISGEVNDDSTEDWNSVGSGGNPGAYLEIVHQHQVFDAIGDQFTSIQSVYENEDVYYDPSASGPITSISFSLDLRTLAPITDAFFTVSDSMGGNFGGFASVTQDGSWSTIELNGATNADFPARDFTGNKLLQFGFGFISESNSAPVTYIAEVDNFKVVINEVPEPCGLLLSVVAVAISRSIRSSHNTN